MTNEYREQDAVRVILLESADAGTTWTPKEDPSTGGGGGGGAGTVIVQENDVTVSTADTIDFNGADFDVTAVGAEANVALSADVVRDADIGTTIQAHSAVLDDIAALTSVPADKMLFTQGVDDYATTDLTSAARSLLQDPSFTAMRSTLGVDIGTDVEAWDADLDDLAARWARATAANAASLAFAEDTDNGVNTATVTAPTSLTASRIFTLPDVANGTLLTNTGGQTVTNKTMALGSNTISGTKAEFDTAVTDGDHVWSGDAAGGDLSGTYPNPTVVDANIDHGSIGGIADDDHTRYVDKSGTRAGTQTFEFGADSGGAVIYRTTSHATKGPHVFGSRVTMGSVAESLYSSVNSQAADFVGAFGQVVGLAASNFLTQVASTNFWLMAVATTNATIATLGTIAIPTGSVMYVKAVIMARKTDETAGAKFERTILVRNNAGVITTDQAVTTVGTDFTGGGCAATLDVSGTDVRVRVTGLAATNFEWTGHVEVFQNTDV